jgi:hypothetical protein
VKIEFGADLNKPSAQVVHDPLLDAGTGEVEDVAGFDLLLGVLVYLLLVFIPYRKIQRAWRKLAPVGLCLIFLQGLNIL